MTVKVNGAALTWLLQATQRKQYISGKQQAQVMSCMLDCESGRLSTTSLVRDGKTSLSHFSVGCSGKKTTSYPIPDIERVLGVLKYHGGDITLSFDEAGGKLLLKSGKKQTTLKATSKGLAYPNSRDTIGAWVEKSKDLASKITEQGYVAADGKIYGAKESVKMDAVTLYEALRCDNMNNQRLNQFTFISKEDSLVVRVGNELKGQTETVLTHIARSTYLEPDDSHTEWSWAFEGGLDTVLSHMTEDVVIDFIDFRELGQGMRMILRFGDSWVYQAGVVR